MVREKARFFWTNLLQYREKETPSFSNGWLQRFQDRAGIRSNAMHGEEGSVSQIADDQMIAVREIVSGYAPKDIFNCDETGLQWRKVPDRSLSTYPLSGKKLDKTRLTAHFCSNSDGTERLPIWFIGSRPIPRPFKASNIRVKNLSVTYKANNPPLHLREEIFAYVILMPG